ncbi:MAG TPA: acetylxylan esterase, partial [Saprospiraceae bacterium]|nr:acetylxylan esterase [Saprospiraceae bacterium]
MHHFSFLARAAAALLLIAPCSCLLAQTACQDPVQPPPAAVETQIWVGADKTFYAVNDTIRFRLRSPADGPCTYTIRRDRYLPVLASGTVDLVANEEKTVSFASDTPCFLMCYASQNWQEASAGVAVDACAITPQVYYPENFEAFWDSLKTELAAVPINPQVTQRPDLSDQAQTTYKMVLDNIDGKKVYGWISIPNCPGPFSAIMHLPSFGSFPLGPVSFEAFDGRIGIAISIHDYDCEQWVPETIAYAPRDHYYSRYTNYYKAAILGCLRAIDYLFTRPEFDGVHVAVTGVSQGGGLTLMAAGLDPRIKFISQGVTALCNHAGFVSGYSSGFPYWAKDAGDHGVDIGKVVQETGYYDAVNFARLYKGPSLNFVGYNDDICPPASVFAAYNQMAGRKTMMHSITTGHLTPPDFWDAR